MKTQTKVLNRFVKWKTAALAAVAVATLASTPALAGDNNDEARLSSPLCVGRAQANPALCRMHTAE